jgi:hypothetical protein
MRRSRAEAVVRTGLIQANNFGLPGARADHPSLEGFQWRTVGPGVPTSMKSRCQEEPWRCCDLTRSVNLTGWPIR